MIVCAPKGAPGATTDYRYNGGSNGRLRLNKGVVVEVKDTRRLQVPCSELMYNFIDHVVSKEQTTTRSQLMRDVIADIEDNDDFKSKIRRTKLGISTWYSDNGLRKLAK